MRKGRRHKNSYSLQCDLSHLVAKREVAVLKNVLNKLFLTRHSWSRGREKRDETQDFPGVSFISCSSGGSSVVAPDTLGLVSMADQS